MRMRRLGRLPDDDRSLAAADSMRCRGGSAGMAPPRRVWGCPRWHTCALAVRVPIKRRRIASLLSLPQVAAALSTRFQYRARGRIRLDHERTFDLRAAEFLVAMVGAASADCQPGLFVLHRLSDAAQPELLVDVRRHSQLHAGRADRH